MDKPRTADIDSDVIAENVLAEQAVAGSSPSRATGFGMTFPRPPLPRNPKFGIPGLFPVQRSAPPQATESAEPEFTEPEAAVAEAEFVEPEAAVAEAEFVEPEAAIKEAEFTEPEAAVAEPAQEIATESNVSAAVSEAISLASAPKIKAETARAAERREKTGHKIGRLLLGVLLIAAIAGMALLIYCAVRN